MKSKRRRVIVAVCVTVCLIVVGATGWLASRVVAWARDLPNRIVIQTTDDPLDTFGKTLIESLHLGLMDESPEIQQQTIQFFADWVAEDRAAIPWVRDEFSADLEMLSRSIERDVADAASSLLTVLAETDANPGSSHTNQPSSGGARKTKKPADDAERSSAGLAKPIVESVRAGDIN